MPKEQTTQERVAALAAKFAKQEKSFGYVKVFSGGKLVSTAKNEQEFAQLKGVLADEIASGSHPNAFAKYIFEDGTTATLGRKAFSELVEPSANQTININL